MSTAQEPTILYKDETEKQHFSQLAKHVSSATGQVHTAESIQPHANLPAVPDNLLERLEKYIEENEDPNKGGLFPWLWQKMGFSTSATFLKKKMEWLDKKHGGKVVWK